MGDATLYLFPLTLIWHRLRAWAYPNILMDLGHLEPTDLIEVVVVEVVALSAVAQEVVHLVA